MFEPVICEKCQKVLQIGMFPFCPHEYGGGAIRRDEIPGGLVMENLGPHPVTVYSHSERERIMKERGLHLIEKFCPMPGTDIDPAGIPNPKGYMDPYTFANAAELICRNGRATSEEPVGVLGSFFEGQLTERDAQAIADGDKGRQSRLGRRIKDATGH